MAKKQLTRRVTCIRATPSPNADDPAFVSLAFQSEDGITLALDAMAKDGELEVCERGQEYTLVIRKAPKK